MIHSTCAPAACAWQNQGMRVAYKPPSFYFKQGPCWLQSGCLAASAAGLCLSAFLSQCLGCRDRTLTSQGQQSFKGLLKLELSAG